MRRTVLPLPLVPLLVSLVWLSPARAAEVRLMNFALPEEGRAERVYFQSASRDESKLASLYHDLIDRGARNVIGFLPRTVVCELPAGVNPRSVSDDPDISFVFDSQVDATSAATRLFEPGWVKRCYARAQDAREEIPRGAPRSESDQSSPWESATIMVSEETVRRTQDSPQSDYPDPRNIHQNSEIMTGSILVNIILPESSPHPFHQENWTDETIEAALGQAALGMMYYQNEYRKAGMSFLVRTVERVLTGVEPINENHKETAWVREIMDRLGYEDDGSPDRHLTAVHEFNNDRRTEFNTQWVFTAFIVNAENDPDHLFLASRTVGWAFLGGPYFVIPHPAGSTSTEQAFKHFLGSMFWALEEGHLAMDGCESYSGYLNAQNKNKTTRYDKTTGAPVGCPGTKPPEGCIMNDVDAFQWFYSGPPCDYTAKMIGVSDLNHNSVPDGLDASPKVYYEHAAVETVFAQGSILRFKVVSEGVPNGNPRQQADLRVNYAVPVKFVGRSESGVVTQRLTPLDGVCDELEEDFEFALDLLGGGSSRFSVVTRNMANAQSEDQIKEIYHIGLTYLHFGYQNHNDGNLIRFDLLGETFDAGVDVHRVDVEGDQQDRVVATGIEPYHSFGSFTLYEFFDEDVIPGEKYRYYVEGTFTTTYRNEDTTVTTRTYDIETRSMIPVPEGSLISGASPNPFQQTTMVSVVIPTMYDDPEAQFPKAIPTDANVWVFDVLGRRVKRLYSERIIGQVVTLIWDGTNENVEKVPAGVYFVKALAGGVEGATKVVVVR